MNRQSIINLVNRQILPLLEQCDRHTADPQPVPFHLSHPDWVEAVYQERLAEVRGAFDATTYYRSPFWRAESAAFDANRQMLRRLPTVTARRLILLDRPWQQQIDEHIDELTAIRRVGSRRMVARYRREDARLREMCRRMQALSATGSRPGFQVRVVYDAGNARGKAVKEFWPVFDCDDTELAIWDDETVDLYGGGTGERVSELHSWSAGRQQDFPGMHATARRYFDRLWAEGVEAGQYFRELRRRLDRCRHSIDFVHNWLSYHESCPDNDEYRMKTEEMERVGHVIDRHRPGTGAYRRYMDVGTGAGRYLARLRERVAADGYLVGVDNDPACISRVEARFGGRGAEADPRVHARSIDFLAAPPPRAGERYDLITLMLGTISHLNYRRNNRNLAETFAQLDRLLTDDGLVVLGTWNRDDPRFRDRDPLLRIYTTHDSDRLKRWTPSIADIRRHARNHRLKLFANEPIQGYYSVLAFTRPPTPAPEDVA